MKNIDGQAVGSNFYFDELLTSDGWRSNARVVVDSFGRVSTFEENVDLQLGDIHIREAACPGIPNVHSHSFQRAIAGHTSTRVQGNQDHFWTWRVEMYKAALQLSPDDVSAIAAQCFLEMIYSGYTSVAEFHYLHKAPNGTPYSNLSELSEAVIRAALKVGLPITHLPVFYRWSGVGSTSPLDEQRRFTLTLDEYADILSTLDSLYKDNTNVKVGIAPHSLRAVSPGELSAITAANFSPRVDRSARPIHIHIAEQIAEVNMWKEHTGQRPIEWLYNHFDPDHRWCLVHATHLSNHELQHIATSGSVVGLCPTTEADLGDGIFPLKSYLDSGGEYGIGSDSNLRVNPAEEFRLLEWGQRLQHQQRNLSFSKQVNSQIDRGAPDQVYQSLGQSLMLSSIRGGGRAVDRATGFQEGCYADWFTLDSSDMGLSAARGHQWSDQWIFAHRHSRVHDVFIGGSKIVNAGTHPLEKQIEQDYNAAIKRLYQ